MPARATKRGADRTRLERDCDVLICGASFAGLAVARELAGSGARVLVIDRYEIGERQTSACGVPTVWLQRLGLTGSLLQTFGELTVHTPWASARWRLPWTFSTFDYRELCADMWEQACVRARAGAHTRAHTSLATHTLTPPSDTGEDPPTSPGEDPPTSPGEDPPTPPAEDSRTPPAHAPRLEFETATVQRREGHTVHTDRGELRAPLIVDCLGWRRVLSNGTPIQPPNARLSRGLEVHPAGAGEEMELWIDPRYVRAGYGWSFPARDEVRIGIGSFWPTHHVKQPTLRLAADLEMPPEGFQGNWIPHQLRRATEDGVFFVGDSAGHCLPVTAEGIRTALYFGIACGRELRAVVEGRTGRDAALARYAAFSDAHEWKYRWMLRSQHAIGRLTPTRAVTVLARALERPRFCEWAFEHYMRIAPPSFVEDTTPRPPRPPRRAAPGARVAAGAGA